MTDPLPPEQSEYYALQLKMDKRTVKALCEVESGLTDDEVNFVEYVARQVDDRNEPLTDSQSKTAQDILNRRSKNNPAKVFPKRRKRD